MGKIGLLFIPTSGHTARGRTKDKREAPKERDKKRNVDNVINKF